MRIRLALLERDRNYLEAVCSSFENKYSDKLEIYSFTDISIALNALKDVKIDVLLADSSFDIDTQVLPPRCAFSYLTDIREAELVKGERAVCKFQKADLIYKYILNLYSEKAENILGSKGDNGKTKVIFFSSVSGGAGTSVLAAATAMRFASRGKKTLYLNFEQLGSADIFFEGSGQFDMSDIIFALKSKRDTLGIKLESCVKHDSSGVYFYSPPKNALDMLELGTEDTLFLLDELKSTGGYDFIIVDVDGSIDKKRCTVLEKAHSIVWVGDGSAVSNGKLIKAYGAMNALDQMTDASLWSRTCLIYNKFSNKTGQTIDNNIGLRSVGGAPRKEGAEVKEIVRWLSEMSMLDNIIM